MEVNLVGTARIERAFLPLAQAGSAAVLFASSAAHTQPALKRSDATLTDPLGAGFWSAMEGDTEDSGNAYMLSKRGVVLYCEHVAPEWGALGARIMTVSPGIIETPMGQRELARQPSMARMIEMTPLRRWGQADEVAAAVEFLVSDGASFITGTDLRIDGGSTPAVNRLMP